MKRFPELRDLSSDHHHGLVLARKAKLTARGEGDLTLDDAWALADEQYGAEDRADPLRVERRAR